jgi:polysaccharide biosynthesis transport protein
MIFFLPLSLRLWARQFITIEDLMENRPIVYDPDHDPTAGREAMPVRSVPRRQYAELPYPEAFEETGPSLLLEYLQILRRRKGTLFLAVFAGLLAALLFTFAQKPVYQARGSIEIQNLNENFLNMRAVNPTAADDGRSYDAGSELNTQARILLSESLLERVITKLDLGKKLFPEEGRDFFSAFRKALGLRDGSQPPTREDILTRVAKNLKISTDANTRLVEIQYDSTDRNLTSEFVQQNLESRSKTSQQTGEWLTHEMENVKTRLEESESQLQSYAKTSGLLFTSEKDNVADEKLRQLQEELSKAQSDRIAKQARYELASTAPPESLPEVLDDATLKEYQVKLTDLRRELAEISSSLTGEHPAVKKVQAQVTTLESALEKERADVTERVRNEFESAKRRESLLTANLASQAVQMSNEAALVTHYNILKHEVDTDRQLYDSMLLNAQEAGMTSALRASNIRVVDPAEPPSRPYKPNLFLNSALGLFVGAFFGVAFIIIQERTDHRIHAPGEAALYLDVPELGTIPSISTTRNKLFAYYENRGGLIGKTTQNGESNTRVELVISQAPSLLADAFRSALTSVLLSGENGKRPGVIVITSANAGEGKTTVASNLALALAEIGRSVLLIDSDLRKPRLHEIFGVPNDWGLTDLLQGKPLNGSNGLVFNSGLAGLLQGKPPNGGNGLVFNSGFRNLCLLPSGSLTSNISELLHSPQALGLLIRMREEFDSVIVDTPPMLHLPDARVLGRIADGVILVVHSAQTKREAAAAASRRLTEDGTRVLGTILNQWDPRRVNEFSYSYANRYYH